jgi:hypothetical protein
VSAAVIDIHRVPLTFVAATTPDRAELLSRRMREAFARALPSALELAVTRDLEDDDAYVFIDRLDVGCLVATHWADDALAAPLAAQIAGAIQRERHLGNALVFRDRAEFVSAFLMAVADGRAIARWWFDEFDGLAALPTSSCIRTVIVTEGPSGWEALARLSPESLVHVISALNGRDAALMLTDLGRQADRGAVSLPRLIGALESAGGVSLPTRSHRLVLALVSLERTVPGAASPRTLAALRGIASLDDAARRGRLLARQDGSAATVRRWCDTAGIGDPDRAAAMDLDSTDLVDHLESQMTGRSDGIAQDTDDEAFDFTPFGGALLLCVVLVRSGWWIAWHDALLSAGLVDRADPLASWLALAVVARALSPGKPSAVEGDPALRRVFGLPARPGAPPRDRAARDALLGALRAGEGGLVAPARAGLRWQLRAWADALLAETGRRIPGCDGSSPGYLRTRCLSLPAAVRADGGAARLGRAPLDVLLVFSGLKRAAVTLPDGRGLTLAEDTTW